MSDVLKQELDSLKEGSAGGERALQAELTSTREKFESELEAKTKVRHRKVAELYANFRWKTWICIYCKSEFCLQQMYFILYQDLEEANKRVEELEKKLIANVPVDVGKEMEAYQQKIVMPLR